MRFLIRNFLRLPKIKKIQCWETTVFTQTKEILSMSLLEFFLFTYHEIVMEPQVFLGSFMKTSTCAVHIYT